MRTQKRGQPKKNLMNKAEAMYAAYLSSRSDVVSWKYEPCSFWLAENMRYNPDFLVEYQDGSIHVVDVKALWKGRTAPHVEDDSMVKMKSMAQMYGGWFVVKMTWYSKETGQWKERHFEQQEREGKGQAD